MDKEKALWLTIVLLIILAWIALRSGPQRQVKVERTCAQSCSESCDWITEGDRGAAAQCFFDCYTEQCEPPLPDPF